MKKKFKIIPIAVIILILSILTIFCSKINKISLMENIKQKVAKAEEIQTANEVTTIDVTDLEDNGNLEHEHIFKTMYDVNAHWEECIICGEKNNDNNHNFEDNGWTLGNSCDENNIHKFSCECGYSYETNEGKMVHNWKESYGFWGINAKKVQYCTKCGIWKTLHDCYKEDGTIISCGNVGKCKICGTNYNNMSGCSVQAMCYLQEDRKSVV